MKKIKSKIKQRLINQIDMFKKTTLYIGKKKHPENIKIYKNYTIDELKAELKDIINNFIY